eukprot:m.189251 g.189251  ORF g.189251 m.189251 type:complete len:358 (-) comp17692_c0_seq1:105-1178(-)
MLHEGPQRTLASPSVGPSRAGMDGNKPARTGPVALGGIASAILSCVMYLVSGPALIILNKRLLTVAGFPYPMFLASLGLGASFSIMLVAWSLGLVTPTVRPSNRFYLTRVVPIGLTQAVTFKFGMQAYIHLSVAFIQMMKSVTPATTMAGLALIGKMPDSTVEVVTVLLICAGTMVAAYGEVHLTITGLICILMAEMAECVKLILTQVLMTDQKFSIVDALLYITPAGFFWLQLGSFVYEFPQMEETGAFAVLSDNLSTFVGCCVLGFAVNTAGFCVIQTTGAVTLKVLGTARNAGLIVFCWIFLNETITALEGLGYIAALTAFSYYSYLQLDKKRREAAPASVPAESTDGSPKALV